MDKGPADVLYGPPHKDGLSMSQIALRVWADEEEDAKTSEGKVQDAAQRPVSELRASARRQAKVWTMIYPYGLGTRYFSALRAGNQMKRAITAIGLFLAAIPGVAQTQTPICEEIDPSNRPVQVGDRVLTPLDVYSIGKGTVIRIGPGNPGVRLSDFDGDELILFIRPDPVDPDLVDPNAPPSRPYVVAGPIPISLIDKRLLEKLLCGTGPVPDATGVSIGVSPDRVRLLRPARDESRKQVLGH